MKTVIIVSKCKRVTNFNREESWYEFHFKGICAGQSLKKVLLRGRKDFHLKQGVEYLLYVQMLSMEQGTLTGHILKTKKLDECWDRS
jgi:hypothetical protein